jgi:carboxylesterase type B
VAPDWLMDPRNTLQIVLVVVQYRVGFMGFFSTGDQSAPGNLGLKDQQLALQWIKNNIASFSGSPNDITVFGDATIQYQLTRPVVVFQKAIITGSYMFSYFQGKGAMTVQEAAKLAKSFGRVSGYEVVTNAQLVEHLQNETIHTIMEVQGLPHVSCLDTLDLNLSVGI